MTLTELAKAHNWNLPTVCGRCGSELFLNASGFPECPDPKCPAKIEHQFAKFFSILGVKIAGPAFIKAAVEDAKDSINPFQYFLMVTKGEDKALFNKWAGGINGEKILAQIETYLWDPFLRGNSNAPKSITTAQFLAMFDYPGLGVKQFEKLKDLSLGNFFNYTWSELNNTNGIGDKMASEILRFRDEYKDEIKDVSHWFNIVDEEEKKADASLPTICFTGACPGHSRKELETMCAGKYTVVPSVTKDTQFLACADPSSGSSKLQKAAKNGTKIISYDDLLAKLN